MGVCGTGKTTIGTLLASQLHLPFLDGDDFHPAANVAKMSEGIPLSDQDRIPWLENIAQATREDRLSAGVVIACSALKQSYRDILESNQANQVHWIFLTGDPAIIQERMNQRKDHFMPPGLLQSQLETLEVPTKAIHVNIATDPESIVQNILQDLS